MYKVYAIWLVFGGIASLLDDLLQPPGHGLNQGPGGPEGKLPTTLSGRSAVDGLLFIRSSCNFQQVEMKDTQSYKKKN